jgi:hypothetical protein
MEGGDIGLGIGAPDGGAMEGGDIGLGMGAPDGGAMEGGDIGLGMGAPDGGAMEGGDIGLGMGAPDGGAMEGGDGGDDGLGSGAADVGGMAGGIGERPGGVWSAASTTTMSFWLAVQLAWLPLMKKKGPERSSVKTVLPPSNLVMYVVVLQALYAAWSTRRTESVSFGYTNTAKTHVNSP